ncbi:MAG: hypothetical protein PHH83_00100 [Patescibacteria group bacterium]|nr:hypothetical protein [Patescibacteria group bacterium]
MKFLKTFLFVFIFLFLFLKFSYAQENRVIVDFFYSPTCSHCSAERRFFDEIQPRFPELVVNRYNITEQENIDKLKEYYKNYNVSEQEYGLVPITFINDEHFVGFDKTIKVNLESKITKYVAECKKPIIDQGCDKQLEGVSKKEQIKIPLLGVINISGIHPFLLSSIFGFLDGFNACALMALAFLLAVLVGTGDRKRILLIGGTFVLVSGIVYFMFISAWLNLFMFLSYIKFLSFIIALLVIFFGITLLREYIVKIVCKICDTPENKKESFLTKFQRKIFVKMSAVGKSSVSIWFAIPIVSMLAAGVNTIELFCSLGFPLAYTKILTTYNLSPIVYYLYILVYIFFYVLDQLVILFIALFSLKITMISERGIRIVKLISGIFLLILGIIILINPGIISSI